MKKHFIRIMSALLAVLLLSACGMTGTESASGILAQIEDLFSGSEETETRTAEAGMVKFSEMEYSRPDIEQFEADIDAVIDVVSDDGAKLKAVIALLDTVDDDYCNFYTMYSLANIHNSLDLTDEYYADEFEWIDLQSSEVSQQIEKMYYACAGSKLGAKLEEEYFWEGFCEDYADESESMYTDEYVALQQLESELLSEYRDLCADPTIEINGETVNYDEYMSIAQNYTDYAGYKKYIKALFAYYNQYAERFADLYIQLIKVRSEMAECAGYEDYRELQYEYTFQRDYTPEEAQQYLDDIATYMASAYEVINEEYPYGNLTTYSLDEDELKDNEKALAQSMGGSIWEAYQYMDEWELSDVGYSDLKADMSFETYLYNYDSPFVFMDAEGDTGDILTYTHEFGHFTDDYVNYGADETLDVAEVYSQGLEMVALGYMDDLMSSARADNMTARKMLDCFDMYCQQAAFAEFENRVYAEDPDQLTAEKIRDIFRDVEIDYGFYEEDFDEYYSQFWIDIGHFFEYPFYVVSYPVSNDIPMQLYALESENEGAALSKYNELLDADHSGIKALAEDAGLESPFAEGRIEAVYNILADYIESYFNMKL